MVLKNNKTYKEATLAMNMMTMSLNLIDKALQYARICRQEETQAENYIYEPLFPDARRNILYLRIRESINKGCRKAVKLIGENWKRSVAYSILMRACYDIFHFGYTPQILNVYNQQLDDIIGTH